MTQEFLIGGSSYQLLIGLALSVNPGSGDNLRPELQTA